MSVETSLDGSALTAHLSGDIDHFTASGIRGEIDRAVRMNAVDLLTLDFSGVTFMDSSGVGLIMGRCKLMTQLGGKCRISSPPAYILKVLRLSGIDKLCPIVSDGGVRI